MKKQYVAFLRGINVGGHHKLPMAELRQTMKTLGFDKVETLLNSGNVIFDAAAGDTAKLERTIAKHLETTFGFPVPTIVRTSAMIQELLQSDPFKNIEVTKDIRLYVSLLRKDAKTDIALPWISEDKSFFILRSSNKTIVSVLDLAINKTPKAMEALEKLFGSDITTRNWNTIKRIAAKLSSGK